MIMNRFAALFFLAAGALHLAAQPSSKKIQEMKDEANALYALELANTASLDLYYELEYKTEGIRGSFSYKDKDSIRTIFFAVIDTTDPKFRQQPDSIKKMYKEEVDYYTVVRSFSYAKSINKARAVVTEQGRKPTLEERKLLDLRIKVFREFDADTAKYKRYKGTTIDFLPIDFNKFYKVYLVTLPNQPGVVIFGNDYYFEFEKKTGTFTKKEKLHQVYYNISPKYNGKKSDPLKYTFHTHKEGDSPFITVTDIFLLMLYNKGVEWEQHWVYSKKWVSTYTLYNQSLVIIDRKTFEKQTKPKEKDPYENPDEHKDDDGN
jgi:hypothetical protein